MEEGEREVQKRMCMKRGRWWEEEGEKQRRIGKWKSKSTVSLWVVAGDN